MAIKFLIGTAEEYAQLKKDNQISAENFYRISETNDMYIGSKKLTSEEDVQRALQYIGTLTDLTTNDKANLVTALNELKMTIDTAANKVSISINEDSLIINTK